ncbi:MAG: carboxymuconolactone decarboxylase family protein, partial [Actinobacteria bacterium]|nr:carboxymuconolactone decarboxylase family protein [Actinomycetota bacterium]
RTGFLCGSAYEWGQHTRISRAVGVSDDDIARVPAGPDAAGWSDHDAAVLRAADELHGSSRIGDATWATLAEAYDERQLLELCFVIGQYHMVAFALRSCGVAPEEGLEPLPEPPG